MLMKKNTDENMDKYRLKVSGIRLNLARELKGLRLKDIAPKFNVEYTTIQKWQLLGIPKKAYPGIAVLFGVEEWVFYDANLSEDAFMEIIINPKSIDKYRPINRTIKKYPILIYDYQNEYKGLGHGSLFRSDLFNISSDTVLINASFFGGKEDSYILVSLEDSIIHSKYPGCSSAMLPKSPQMSVFFQKQKDDEQVSIAQQFFHHITPGDYYLNIHSEYKFEVLVYEMESFPGS